MGGLTSVTDPTGAQINYANDKTGRVTGVTGTTFGGVTQYLSNVQYRAWNGVESSTSGDGRTTTISYNSRLLPTDFAVSTLMSKHYDYNADGNLRYSQDLMNAKFDRSYAYDHAGRVTQALSGPAARGLADTDDRPYNLTFSYDYLDHLTTRSGKVWNVNHHADTGGNVYTNNRNTAWSYDADGRLTGTFESSYDLDAAGRALSVLTEDNLGNSTSQVQVFDGDGTRTKLYTDRIIYSSDSANPDPNEPLPILTIPGGSGDAFAPEDAIDGIAMPFWVVKRLLNSDAVARCPNNDCGPQSINGHIARLGFNPETGNLGYYYWDNEYKREQPVDNPDDDVVRVNNQGKYVWSDAVSSGVDLARMAGGGLDTWLNMRPLTPQHSGEEKLSAEQSHVVWNALMLAKGALEKNELCRKYVGGGAYDAMRKLWDSGRYTYFHGLQLAKEIDPAWAVTGPGPGLFARYRAVLLSGFFDVNMMNDPNLNGARFLGVTPEVFQAVILLHEVRHYLCPGCKYAEPHDGYTWNRDIIKYCF